MLRAVVPNGTSHAGVTYKAGSFVPAVLWCSSYPEGQKWQE